MAVLKQGGANPNSGLVNTTMGLVAPRSPLCWKCRERKPGLYTVDANGQQICGECSGEYGRGVLTGEQDSVFDVLPDTDGGKVVGSDG